MDMAPKTCFTKWTTSFAIVGTVKNNIIWGNVEYWSQSFRNPALGSSSGNLLGCYVDQLKVPRPTPNFAFSFRLALLQLGCQVAYVVSE
jgi:hypothetical protein